MAISSLRNAATITGNKSRILNPLLISPNSYPGTSHERHPKEIELKIELVRAELK